MNRMMALLFMCAVMLSFPLLGFAPSSNSATRTYKGKVNNIIAWITQKQSPTTPTGLDEWNNTLLTSAKTDSVAIFRLVTNVNVTLTASTQGILTEGTTGETLATFYQISSDGNGSSATGFQASQNGNGVGSFAYKGGGNSTWSSDNGYTASTFLGASGKTITHVNQDGNVLLTVTVRGWNGEDFGSNSDLTEAPDFSTNYTASLTLVATYSP